MKKTLILALIVMSALSAASQTSYTISGTINEGFDGKYIYITNLQNRKWVRTDSTIIANNSFTFEGTVDQPKTIYLLLYNNDKGMARDLILENANITVNLTAGDKLEGTVTGTKANECNNKQLAIAHDFNVAAEEIDQMLKDSTLQQSEKDSLKALFVPLQDKALGQIAELAENNMDNFGGLMLINNYGFYTEWKKSKTRDLLTKVPAELQTTDEYKNINNYVERLAPTAEGEKFIDIEGKTPEGNDMKLSDYAGKGKVVLVDFWASWCGPCINEMPNVVKAYEQYKDKGLEIVGYSLDNNETNWKTALTNHNMTWPQMSDLQGWKAAGATTYGIMAIPATVIIDKDGTIVARNLRGEEMINKIAELLK